MPADAPNIDDVVEVPPDEWREDAREDVKVIASIPGRYQLANRRNLKGERCQFACRIVNLSLSAMVLAAPVPGQLSERVIVYTEMFGRLHGLITRLVPNGFVMSIAATEQTREKLAAKLAWLDKQKDSPDLPDGRRHARVVPRNPMAQILLADGSTRSCLVIDFSDSGAAVSADLDAEIGTPLAVGKMIGRVVRRFAEGFAIEFLNEETLADVERKLASVDSKWRPPRNALRRQ
ncbi:MAG TPA: PilZ domain-containing protein [Xanthobacteraceae bacterium]|nr:PilZ domain-containing protein [Xanthobacteraceae bacterium]